MSFFNIFVAFFVYSFIPKYLSEYGSMHSYKKYLQLTYILYTCSLSTWEVY